MKEEQEFKQKPGISLGSAKIISKRWASYDSSKQNKFGNSSFLENSNSKIYKELHREMLLKVKEELSIKEKPEINKTSQLLERKVNDLFQWK